MKILTLLLLLMMSSGLGGENIASSRQAVDAGAHEEGLGARHEYGTKHQINAFEEKSHSSDERLFSTGLSNEVEVQRLKLMLLLLMSLGPYHTAVH